VTGPANVELHRRFYRALNVGDADGLVVLCDPSIEVRSVFASAVGGTVYRGRDGARKWLHDLAESWGGEFGIEPKVYFDLGRQTLCFGVLHGRGARSGVAVAMDGTALATWRDGLCVFHKGYQRKADALADLGVSGDELEPIEP
jgi:ketosteroid isomerase-like protein